MRTILTILVGILATIVCATTVIVASVCGVEDRPGSIYERCIRGWARVVMWAAGARVHVHGAENAVHAEGAVYIANHVSWFDIFALASYLPRTTFVAKQELQRIPLFGKGAEHAGIIFLDRENRKAAFESYRVAAKSVQGGRALVVCPEGTRGLDYHLRPFKKGPFVLAISAAAPLVPTVVYGAREVMPKGSFRVRSGDVHLHFLPAVATEGTAYEDRTALMQGVWTVMADTLRDSYGVESAPVGQQV